MASLGFAACLQKLLISLFIYKLGLPLFPYL